MVDRLGLKEKVASLIPKNIVKLQPTPLLLKPTYDPMAPYAISTTLEDINSRILQLEQYMPEPIAI